MSRRGPGLEGNTTIVPVVEERFVVVKQLFLREELHIRHVIEPDVVREVVPLRRQKAMVERFGADGISVPLDGDGRSGES